MTSGLTAFLVDTKVPIYAVDPRDAIKQQRAIDVLDRLDSMQTGALGVQNMHEFLSVATRRLSPPLPMDDAIRIVRYFLRRWQILPLTPDVTSEAIRGVEQHRLSWWDSLVWATALVNHIPTILSEDFNSGAVVDGVRFLNPFDQMFHLSSLQ